MAQIFLFGRVENDLEVQISQIWITGTLQMVDATDSQGTIKTKLLKVYLTNWGYISLRSTTYSHAGSKDAPVTPEAVSPSSAEILDGDRDFLPE